jgi:hypothetical protein
MDKDALQAAAELSGGRFFPAENAAELIDTLPVGKAEYSGPVRTIRLWDHPLIWGLVLSLLAGEWFLRRSWGLV